MVAQKRSSLSWAVRAAGCVLLLFLAVVLYGYASQYQLAKKRDQTKANLKHISSALQQYYEEYDSFPPAFIVGKDEERWHSWRVLILPYLGETEKQLYSQYRFDEPWNGPHNAKLAASMPDVFLSPYGYGENNTTPYLAIVGRRTMWPGPVAVTLRDIQDGSSNTVQLMENPESAISWMEPKDSTHLEVQELLNRLSSEGSDQDLLVTAFADGSVRSLSVRIEPKVFHSLLTPQGGRPLVSKDVLPDETRQMPDYDFGIPQNVATAKQTTIMPYLEAKITPGENLIYCATFQLAWDELREVYQDEEILLDPPSEMAVELNRARFPHQSLAPESYAALSGSVEEIKAAMAKRFPNVSPMLTPPPVLTSPPILLPYVTCYAYLEKRLPFNDEFDKLEKPILFGDEKQPVNGFGLSPSVTDSDTGDGVFESQVEVLDYISDDDFILQLSTVGPQRDQILLARVEPGATLQATLDRVRTRIEQPHQHHTRFQLETVDTLAVPVVLFNYMRSYQELEGLHLTNLAPPGHEDLGNHPWIEVARQMIQFRLDETGGILLSQAEIQVVGEFGEPESPPPPKPRHFVFDQPFLMVLQEEYAEAPYLVAWIANAEVLEKAGK